MQTIVMNNMRVWPSVIGGHILRPPPSACRGSAISSRPDDAPNLLPVSSRRSNSTPRKALDRNSLHIIYTRS